VEKLYSFKVKQIGEWERVAEQILNSSRTIFILAGPLGAGKTTLVQEIARQLGWDGRVLSPTFTLQNLYPTTPPIYHYDLYRKGIGQFLGLGLLEELEQKGYHFIEWGKELEPVLTQLQIPFGEVTIQLNGEERRVECRC